MGVRLLLEGDFIMIKQGDTFQTYSNELKIQFVKSYLNGEDSQSAIAKNTINKLGSKIPGNMRYFRFTKKQW